MSMTGHLQEPAAQLCEVKYAGDPGTALQPGAAWSCPGLWGLQGMEWPAAPVPRCSDHSHLINLSRSLPGSLLA